MLDPENTYADRRTIEKVQEVHTILHEQGPRIMADLIRTGVANKNTLYNYQEKGYIVKDAEGNMQPGILPRGLSDRDPQLSSARFEGLFHSDDKAIKQEPTELQRIAESNERIVNLLMLMTENLPVERTGKIKRASAKDDKMLELRKLATAWLKAQEMNWNNVSELVEEVLPADKINLSTRILIMLNLEFSIRKDIDAAIERLGKSINKTKTTRVDKTDI